MTLPNLIIDGVSVRTTSPQSLIDLVRGWVLSSFPTFSYIKVLSLFYTCSFSLMLIQRPIFSMLLFNR